jgi:3-phenylpropionate/cinnamic acid dioxygenase small subunit
MADVDPGTRVSVADPVYDDVVRFLYAEASLLDHDQLQEWTGLLADDVVYRAPVRLTRHRREGAGFSDRSFHFNEDGMSLKGRVFRLVGTSSGWAEDPPSRCRRLVSNVVVERTSRAAEYAVTSYLLVVRHRFNDPAADVISAERKDVLRATEAGLRLASRTILLDDTTLSTPNLAIFL